MPEILYKGWSSPSVWWLACLDEVSKDPYFTTHWERVGISNAIRATRIAFQPDPTLLKEVISYWHEHTGTFISQIGEIG